jgi:hypothetical protein
VIWSGPTSAFFKRSSRGMAAKEPEGYQLEMIKI